MAPKAAAPRSPAKVQAIAVITGCNAGLGFHAALTLIKQNAIVVLGCRNIEAASEAKQELLRLTGCPEDRLVILESLDLTDLGSVRKFAASVRLWLGTRTLTALVNNAGVGASPWGPRKSTSGAELCFSTNHLGERPARRPPPAPRRTTPPTPRCPSSHPTPRATGHFLLTLLLLPCISSRVVNVSSEVHDPASGAPFPDPSDHWPASQEEYDSVLLEGTPVGGEDARRSSERHYCRSKLCNVLFTYELARRLSGAAPAAAEPEVAAAVRALPGTAGCSLPHARGVSVAAFNPGLMLDTNFVTSSAGTVTGWVAWLFTPLVRLSPFGHLLATGPASGATLARLAMSELKATAPTSVYFDKANERPSSEFSRRARLHPLSSLPPSLALRGPPRAITSHCVLGAESLPRPCCPGPSRSRDALTRAAPELWAHSVRWAGVTAEELRSAGLTGW